MGKINSKRKGAEGELKFKNLCIENGYNARRSVQYCGKTDGTADVVGLPGIHVEVKFVEQLNLRDAMAQSVRDAEKDGNIPIVAHKKSRCPWLITMLADDWFKLYREWEAGMALKGQEQS